MSEKIISQNRLIEKFMGWELVCLNPNDEDKIYQFQRTENGKVVEVNVGGDSWSWCEGDVLSYHKDWNLLMSVIEKIETCGVIVEMSICLASHCRIIKGSFKNPIETIADFESDKLFTAIYKSCIQFIEWYNKKTK